MLPLVTSSKSRFVDHTLSLLICRKMLTKMKLKHWKLTCHPPPLLHPTHPQGTPRKWEGGSVRFSPPFSPPSFFPLSAAPAPPINKKSALNPRKSLWTKAPALFSEKMGGGGSVRFSPPFPPPSFFPSRPRPPRP